MGSELLHGLGISVARRRPIARGPALVLCSFPKWKFPFSIPKWERSDGEVGPKNSRKSLLLVPEHQFQQS